MIVQETSQKHFKFSAALAQPRQLSAFILRETLSLTPLDLVFTGTQVPKTPAPIPGSDLSERRQVAISLVAMRSGRRCEIAEISVSAAKSL